MLRKLKLLILDKNGDAIDNLLWNWIKMKQKTVNLL